MHRHTISPEPLAQKFRRAARVMKHAAVAAKFDPNQPRVPAGNSDGGQWTDTGGSRSTGGGSTGGTRAGKEPRSRDAGVPIDWRQVRREALTDGSGERAVYAAGDGTKILSERRTGLISGRQSSRQIVEMPDGSSLRVDNGRDGVQRIHDSDGALVSASRWGRNGPESVAAVEPANHLTLLRPPSAVGDPLSQIAAGIALFNQMVGALLPGQPVISFRAQEFVGSRIRNEGLEFVGSVSERDVERACPRYPDVRHLTNKFATELRPMYRGKPQEFGTAVHTAIKRQVNGERNKNFVAEESILKSQEAFGDKARQTYGTNATLRVDVYENLANNTVCVYDIKTGRRGLSAARTAEIADAVHRRFNQAERFLIIEVRPD